MHVGQQMVRAEITVRRYNRSSCLICQDEGWHSASFIHCQWKYERDLRHLVLAQKGKAKKSSKWQMTRNPFSSDLVAASPAQPQPQTFSIESCRQIESQQRAVWWVGFREKTEQMWGRHFPSSSLLLIFNNRWLSAVSWTASPKAFVAVVFIVLLGHCLSAWVDYKSSLY